MAGHPASSAPRRCRRAQHQATARAKGLLRVDDPESHRGRTRSVGGDEGKAVASGFFIDEIVDVALAIDRDLPGAVAGTGAYPISLNSACKPPGLGMGLSTNPKPSVPIGLAAYTVAAGASSREWTHGEAPVSGWLWLMLFGRKVRAKQRACRYQYARSIHRLSWRCNFDRTANIATATCRRMRRRPASAAMSARSARTASRRNSTMSARTAAAALRHGRSGQPGSGGRAPQPRTAAVRPARPSEIRPRRHRRALRPHSRHRAGGSVNQEP